MQFHSHDLPHSAIGRARSSFLDHPRLIHFWQSYRRLTEHLPKAFRPLFALYLDAIALLIVSPRPLPAIIYVIPENTRFSILVLPNTGEPYPTNFKDSVDLMPFTQALRAPDRTLQGGISPAGRPSDGGPRL